MNASRAERWRRCGGRTRRGVLGGAVVLLSLAAAVGTRGENPTAGAAAAAVDALGRGNFADALRIVRQARPEARATLGDGDPAVLTLSILEGQAAFGLGRPDEAAAALEPFLRGSSPETPLVSRESDWNALAVLGDSLMALDRWDEALACLERALALVPAEGAVAARAIDRATTLGKIGTAKARLADWDGARAAFEEQERTLAGEPDGGGAYRAAACNGLGLVADNRGDHAAAARHYAEAARIYERSLGPEHPYTTRALLTLHRAQSLLGRSDEAAATAVALADRGVAVADVLPATLPAAAAAPRRDFPTLAVTAAVAAAVVLAALLLAGSFRRGTGGDGADPDRAE